ncbi:hypothetical protein [Dinoroseobacter sp. S375]|uniref:hypothetical protein n=1 Tax=Dinoroseobacter sp. S375 TaxID=3415136 RepID=UPI003C7E5932
MGNYDSRGGSGPRHVRGTMMGQVRGWAGAVCAAALCVGPGVASGFELDPAWERHVTVFGASMTENTSFEILRFEVDWADSYLVGLAFGAERQIGASRFSWGVEGQIVRHFGQMDHWEVNLPVVLRYTPPNPWIDSFESFAYGLGLSHATEVPSVEVERTGESQRNFFYWKAELEFNLPSPDTALLLGMHHRSDGYGVFDADSGSTALSVGFKRSF